jgi:formate hydrogenlyase subunit 6/NADH:ubiquinone oxidoreductase subunit I
MYGSGAVKMLAMTFFHQLRAHVATVPGRLQRGWQRGRLTGRRSSGSERPLNEGERYGTLPCFVIDARTERLRCTACGICVQVCPVQCIWIQRAEEPVTGRPRRYPLTYHLDTALCMSCGYCVELCPFDALRMDQAAEPASHLRPGFLSARRLLKAE